MKTLCIFLSMAACIFLTGARYKFDPDKEIADLNTSQVFLIELNRNGGPWLTDRMEGLLRGILGERDREKRKALSVAVAARYGELFVAPQGRAYIENLQATSYISIHRKLAKVMENVNPKGLEVIQSFLMDMWGCSKTEDIDTFRKFLYLVGVFSSSESDVWQTDPERMLRDFRENHEKHIKYSTEKMAYFLFFEVSGHTVRGSLSLTKEEYLGYKWLFHFISKNSGREYPNLAVFTCEGFLKNSGGLKH